MSNITILVKCIGNHLEECGFAKTKLGINCEFVKNPYRVCIYAIWDFDSVLVSIIDIFEGFEILKFRVVELPTFNIYFEAFLNNKKNTT